MSKTKPGKNIKKSFIDSGKTNTPPSTLAKNLRTLLDRANLSEHELSRRTGVKQPVIHRILSSANTNPKLLTLRSLADYFLLSISQLIGEDDISQMWRGQTSNTHKGWSTVSIINYAAIINPSKHKPAKTVSTEGNASENAFAYYVSDQSMEPIFPKSCIVITEPNLAPVHQNYIVIRNSNNELLLRIYLVIDTKKYIMPLNNSFGTISALLDDDVILGTVTRTIFDHLHE